MITHELEPFQEQGVISVSQALAHNMRVLAVSPTGSGKTVILSTIANRYVKKSGKQVVIFVHKKELVDQTRQKLYDWYGIVAQKITADTKEIRDSDVYVAMVETFNNRSKNPKFFDLFKNVGLVIIDEAHMSNFKKIIGPFGTCKIIGVTATPIAATKKDPLKNYYQKMVIISTIQELLELNEVKPLRGVVPAREYSLQKGIRERLEKKGDDFDESQMGKEFSKSRQIQNVIDAYVKYGIGKKTICFNADIEHSILMTEAFIANGFNARHLDSKKTGKYGSDAYRDACFKWLKETPNAILCNVGIATTGFDEPSIETVIVNRSTMSFSLWKQMIGRGGRPYLYPDGMFKPDFLLLDMGDNIESGGMGRYDSPVDWEEIFNNPKISKPGVGGVKTCPECGCILYSSARYCDGKVECFFTGEQTECGYIFPAPSQEQDFTERVMVKIGGGIDVHAAIEFFKDRSEWASYFELVNQVCNLTRKEVGDEYLDAFRIEQLVELAQKKASEWLKIKGKRKYINFKQDIKDKVILKLKNLGFIIPVEEILEVGD